MNFANTCNNNQPKDLFEVIGVCANDSIMHLELPSIVNH